MIPALYERPLEIIIRIWMNMSFNILSLPHLMQHLFLFCEFRFKSIYILFKNLIAYCFSMYCCVDFFSWSCYRPWFKHGRTHSNNTNSKSALTFFLLTINWNLFGRNILIFTNIFMKDSMLVWQYDFFFHETLVHKSKNAPSEINSIYLCLKLFTVWN